MNRGCDAVLIYERRRCSAVTGPARALEVPLPKHDPCRLVFSPPVCGLYKRETAGTVSTPLDREDVSGQLDAVSAARTDHHIRLDRCFDLSFDINVLAADHATLEIDGLSELHQNSSGVITGGGVFCRSQALAGTLTFC